MTDRDDAPFDPADPTRPAKAPRPRDAATLILIRTTREGPRVLMGQRSKGHVFMPDKWVFPGGAVDRADAAAPAASELTPSCEARLRAEGARRAPRAFPLAAVRETWEETGLIVGRRGAPAVKAPPGWESYLAADAAPELAKLTFICRAITPPYRPRRFDARFFMAHAEEVLMDDRPIGGGPELLHTEWFALDDALKLDLPSVTRFVLGEVQERLKGEALAPPFLRWSRGGHRMDRLH
ncbi:MAG: NUDIX hydrolase [Hyphomonadaceae bacterium]|nr:NUDIX hydrolase [Hyphomonadaceae bacterium]